MKKVLFLFLLVISFFGGFLNASSLYEKLINKETISVGTEGIYPPFTYHNKEGKLTGYDVEVARELAKELGVKIKFHETSWDIMLTGLKSGRFDMVANQVSLTTKKRQAAFDKSLPYSYSGTIMLVRKDENRIKDIKDIRGLKAANTLSSTYGEIAFKYDAQIVSVDSMVQALLLVAQKRADLTLNSSLAILNYLNTHKNNPFKIAWESQEKDGGASFVINKHQEKALELINQAMQRLINKGVLKRLGEQFLEKMSANPNLSLFFESLDLSKERLELLLEAFYPMLKAAFCISLPLAIISFILGLLIAIVVALIKIAPPKHFIHKALLAGVNFYVSLIRGTPLLVQIVVVFYGLPALGVYMDPIPAGIIAFSFNVGAYASETLRASFLSVPKDQWDSSLSLGLNYLQTFWHVIFFQALKVATPSLSNTFISLFKETSLASVVTIAEVFRIAQQKANASYDFLPIYLEAALIYWLFCLVLEVIQKRMEKILN